jgi:prolyl-tRNA editing enzyme YbaK/EbsC (Cys-tRNA(Pro) deacylase)
MNAPLSKYHPCVTQILEILDQKNIWYEVFEHEPVRTSEEAAEARPRYELKQGTKALILRVKRSGEKFFVMVVVPGNLRFENKKVKDLLGSQDIRFAFEEEVSKITDGIKLGGLPPFGNLFNLNVYADPKVFNNEVIVFNAGDKRVSLAMKSSDYQELVHPQVADLT